MGLIAQAYAAISIQNHFLRLRRVYLHDWIRYLRTK